MAFPPPPAYPAADQEEATPPPDAEDAAEAPEPGGADEAEGEGEKENKVYLPKNFPFTKPLKDGDEQKALITMTYSEEDSDDKHYCFEIQTVDGVPITPEAEAQDEADQKEVPTTGSDDTDDTSQQPQDAGTPPSTPNDVTKMIMSGAGQ